jgi:ATP-binding cassette subfamily B protein
MKRTAKLFKWSKNHKLALLWVLFLAVITPFTYSYVPLFIKYIFDRVLTTAPSHIGLPNFLLTYFGKFSGLDAVLVVGIFLLTFQLIRSGILFANSYYRGRLSQSISYDIRNRLYDHIQDLSYEYHNNANTGDLLQRCTSDVETVQAFISSQLPQLINVFAQFLFGSIQLFLINPYIMLAASVLSPVTLVVSIIYFRYITRKFKEIEETESQMTTNIQENINGIRVVKAFNTEIESIESFDKDNSKYRNQYRQFQTISALYWGGTDFLSLLQYTAIFGIAIYLTQRGTLSAGDVITALMYVGMLVWPIRNLGRLIGDFGKTIVASDRIDEVLNTHSEYEIDGTLEPTITGEIEFRDVKYNYHENSDLLKGVSFKIKPGQTVAIVGKTGAGKSTIASLLTRLIDASEGEIIIDGVNIKDIKKKHVRNSIGLVLQDPFLFAKSVYDNISIGHPSVSEKDVVKAAQTASIHADIIRFDSGYKTEVGEKGVTLSGGQKQRIAIARMLLLKKPVVIFDDSLSAVDTTTDLLIRQALKLQNKDLTSIIITHRITTAKEADVIIVLEDGIASAIGTHEELSKQEGLYKNLWDIQGDLEENFLEHIKGGE